MKIIQNIIYRQPKAGEKKMEDKVKRTEEEWKKVLSDEEYNVLRKKGTERAFTGEYNDFKEEGIYMRSLRKLPFWL